MSECPLSVSDPTPRDFTFPASQVSLRVTTLIFSGYIPMFASKKSPSLVVKSPFFCAGKNLHCMENP
jgi:hypothetical protein